MRVLRVREGAWTHSDELLIWKQILSVESPSRSRKTWPMVNADCPHVIHRANKGADTMGIKHDVSYRSGENMAKKTDEELYDVAINMIGSVAKLPVIRVDRKRSCGSNSPIRNISMRF